MTPKGGYQLTAARGCSVRPLTKTRVQQSYLLDPQPMRLV